MCGCHLNRVTDQLYCVHTDVKFYISVTYNSCIGWNLLV